MGGLKTSVSSDEGGGSTGCLAPGCEAEKSCFPLIALNDLKRIGLLTKQVSSRQEPIMQKDTSSPPFLVASVFEDPNDKLWAWNKIFFEVCSTRPS